MTPAQEYCRFRYEQAVRLLQDPTSVGFRNKTIVPALAWSATKLGLSADSVWADVSTAGFHDADIRRQVYHGMQTAKNNPKMLACSTGTFPWRPSALRPAKPVPNPWIGYVRQLISAGGNSVSFDDLRNRSPLTIPGNPARQAGMWLQSLWQPTDVLHLFRKENRSKGLPGSDLMPMVEWLPQLPTPNDLILANPLTGDAVTNAAGNTSFVTGDNIARFPYLVLEMDDLPLAQQCAFWVGFLQKSRLASRLASLVYSGNKSIHGLLYLQASSKDAWDRSAAQIKELFASDPEKTNLTRDDGTTACGYPYRADTAVMNVRSATRIAGAIRQLGEGKTSLQELLYLRPTSMSTSRA